MTEMTAFLDSHIELLSVIWLLPIIFMFHDFEEILTIEKWIRKHGDAVLGRIPTPARRIVASSFKMDTRQFATDVLWIYTIIVIATGLAVFLDFYVPFLVVLAIFFVHVFTHLGQAIFLRIYTPGVGTAVVLVLPYSIYAYYRLLDSNAIDWHDIFLSLILMAVLLPVGVWLLIKGRSTAIQRSAKG